MNKLLLTILFACVFPVLIFSQNVEYYKAIADGSEDPLTRLEAMDSVISKTHRKDDDTFVDYTLRYIEIAKDIDSIHAAARKAMRLQYIISNKKNQPEKAITVINGVLAHKYKISDSFLLGGLYLKRGGAHFRIDLKKAIDDYSLALENFSVNDSVYVADAYLFQGQAYSNLGKFVPAGESYKQAYNYYEALKDYEYMVHAQQGITTMFSMNGFFEKAKQERDKIIEKLIALDLQDYLVFEYYNQALDYEKMGDKKSYFDYLTKAISSLNDNSEDQRDMQRSIMVHAKLAEYYAAEKDIENATRQIELISDWIEETTDFNSQISYNGAVSRYHLALDDNNTALLYAKNKLEVSQAYSYTDAILESHKLLGEIYFSLGQFDKSIASKDAYISIKDSIYNRGTANSLAYYQTLYETEKKEKELLEQKSNIQLLEKDNDTFKKVLIFWIVALLLFFSLILLFRNQIHLKNKKQLQEKFSQDLLVSQEIERKRISKDLHDGLGQRLLLIKNKLIGSGTSDAKTMIDETINEVRDISRNLHPFQLQELGITKALEHTIYQIDENTPLFISSEIDNIDNIFSKEQEANIYRMVQESLSNILRHAQAKATKVMIKKFKESVTITIKDNGVGFDFTEKFNNARSLGLKTLLERTKFLNGHMKVQSEDKSGTTLEFQLPFE